MLNCLLFIIKLALLQKKYMIRRIQNVLVDLYFSQ